MVEGFNLVLKKMPQLAFMASTAAPTVIARVVKEHIKFVSLCQAHGVQVNATSSFDMGRAESISQKRLFVDFPNALSSLFVADKLRRWCARHAWIGNFTISKNSGDGKQGYRELALIGGRSKSYGAHNLRCGSAQRYQGGRHSQEKTTMINILLYYTRDVCTYVLYV